MDRYVIEGTPAVARKVEEFVTFILYSRLQWPITTTLYVLELPYEATFRN